MIHIAIDEEWCKGCYLCIHYCPKKIFAKSKRRNLRGYTLPQLTGPENCTSCKSCEFICPELAITVGNEREE
jgi:2-oxoglutarate ferredoxin oxidoreductase subunit delta